MTRLMPDAVNAWAIPTGYPIVAGYVDCSFAWGVNAWSRFPDAVKVRIAAGCDPKDAQVADVENGDYLPWEAVDFCLVQRAKGIDPTVYVNLSNWNPTRNEFRLRGVPEPHWWLALYDGVATIPTGCVAKQYANSAMTGGNYDLSIVADFWPGVDSTFGPGGGSLGDDMTPEQEEKLDAVSAGVRFIQGALFWSDDPAVQPYDANFLPQIRGFVARLKAALSPANVTVDNTAVLAAIADLKAHPATADPAVLALVQKIEKALQGA